ncbi:30S ribosomal protein S8, putative [Bodo saltans]|uniref:30S ribosomal protein S8, putative n=1 Tax=Bodo saltans TaxID=75058 RepID=A0A0S4J6E1_BODSA|nr:30S ribosomal protein S8, putative [Bodo saltans]|eukprot:CUG82298.1 30S ribosomal protein S8, putative [Bodo saltans]
MLPAPFLFPFYVCLCLFKVMQASARLCARVSGVAWNPQSSKVLRNHERYGSIHAVAGQSQQVFESRLHLSKILAQPGFLDQDPRPTKPLVDLPGVTFKSDLPADPITRLFFQQKGEYALYQGDYVTPVAKDSDRVQIERRESKWGKEHAYQMKTPVYDFCHRIREGSEQRKRFVIVPSTPETKGCAQVMHDHGLIAGFRDFHNDRAFAVELKYFQNEPTITMIAPSSIDGKQEFEWSPKMMRRMMYSHGIHNRLQIFICRAADGRVIDHLTAVREHIGGRGLLQVC